MSRDGNGQYSRIPGSAYTNGTTADGAEVDAEMDDIAAALTASIAKDGQTVPTANLPMGGFKHTNCAVSSTRTDYARASQVQDGAFTYLTSVSGADTITATGAIGLSAYAAGQQFVFFAADANTGPVTLNINAIGEKDVVKNGTTALVAGDIPAGAACVVIHDGTRFQLVGVQGVSRSGNETIAGVKTFTSSPVVPTATTSTEAANKGQMDTAISTAVAAAVTPATIAPTLFVETTFELLSGLSSVEWTVPSWVRRITVIVVDASGAASGVAAVRIGTGTIETTGYTGCCTEHAGNSRAANSTLWHLATSAGAGDSFTFSVTITRSHNNYWVYESSGSPTNSSNNMTGCGQKNLSGALQTVQLLLTSSDTFDAGVATLFYE